MKQKIKELAINEKDTGSSEIQVGLLTEKISKVLHKKPLTVKECLIRMREEEVRKEC